MVEFGSIEWTYSKVVCQSSILRHLHFFIKQFKH